MRCEYFLIMKILYKMLQKFQNKNFHLATKYNIK